jgi:hypothetical protein
MQTKESNDPKMELLKKSERHRQELKDEVRLISERTEHIITNALIIGGTLAASYFIMRQFASSSPKKRKKASTPKIKLVKADEPTSDPEATEGHPNQVLYHRLELRLPARRRFFF